MKGLEEIEHLIEEDYTDYTAKEFSNMVCEYLQKGEKKFEVRVQDRGDARTGRIDLVYTVDNIRVGIEFDRFYPRKKSIIKLKNLHDLDERYIITRSPFTVHKISPSSTQ